MAQYGRLIDPGSAWEELTGNNPTDRGKQGVKRSLLVEATGIPIGLAVAGANCHDTKLMRQPLVSIPAHASRPEVNAQSPAGVVSGQGL